MPPGTNSPCSSTKARITTRSHSAPPPKSSARYSALNAYPASPSHYAAPPHLPGRQPERDPEPHVATAGDLRAPPTKGAPSSVCRDSSTQTPTTGQQSGPAGSGAGPWPPAHDSPWAAVATSAAIAYLCQRSVGFPGGRAILQDFLEELSDSDPDSTSSSESDASSLEGLGAPAVSPWKGPHGPGAGPQGVVLPVGWRCRWDEAKGQYCYVDPASSVTQWVPPPVPTGQRRPLNR